VGLERGPLSLVSRAEELLGRKKNLKITDVSNMVILFRNTSKTTFAKYFL
jgi:hypothetical protein